MTLKRILLVDDDKSVLTVLKNSLKKLDTPCRIVTATNGFEALDALQQEPFDVVVADFNMPEMDGLELIEAIRYARPEARIIMITAYGTPYLETKVEQLHAYRYLTKPLDIRAFRHIIAEALQASAPDDASVSVYMDEQFDRLNRLLAQLKTDVNAHCLVLTDLEGHAIARIGNTERLPVQEMASLLGGGIATLREAGRMLDADSDAIHLAYRESKKHYLYALNIGRQFLLLIIINRGPYASRLGTVWYYAQQAAVDMFHLLNQTTLKAHRRISNPALGEAIGEELDKLFGE